MAKIVFCEDDPTIQKLIRIAMRASPHTIYIAPDGVAGLALIEREQPDLIVTDVSMPGLDGFQLTAAVKARPSLTNIPVMFMSASVQRTEVDEGLRRGAAAYLRKPFGPAELRVKLEEVLGGAT